MRTGNTEVQHFESIKHVSESPTLCYHSVISPHKSELLPPPKLLGAYTEAALQFGPAPWLKLKCEKAVYFQHMMRHGAVAQD